MEISTTFKSSQPSVISPEGKYVATLNGSRLDIRRVSTLDVVRTIHVPSTAGSKFICMRWSPVTKGVGTSERILVSDEDITRVWDLEDNEWSATIDNGTGSMGQVANVEFGTDDTEVMVFSSFGAKVTVWSLWTGKGVELKDPKFANKGFGRSRHGRSGIFALLSRPGPRDVLNFYVPDSYSPIKSINLPTVDAQSLKWSPDGRWLAVSDTPSTGYKVLIYTADGNLYRTYCGDYFDDKLHGLGVKRIEWSPNGDFLAVAGFEKSVALLSTRTFSPAVYLMHAGSIKQTSADVWLEQVTATDRSYVSMSPSISPPLSPAQWGQSDSIPQLGVSIMAFSSDGNFLATRDDSMPTVVWIWDLSQLKPCAILMQHSVIKRLLWHPTNPDVLLIQCIQAESILYYWNARENQPRILQMPSCSFSGKAEASWVPKQMHRKPNLMFGDMHGFSFGYPEGRDEFGSPLLEPEAADEESVTAASENDSLFEILSGKDAPHGSEDLASKTNTEFDAPGLIDDTFQYRKGVGVY